MLKQSGELSDSEEEACFDCVGNNSVVALCLDVPGCGKIVPGGYFLALPWVGLSRFKVVSCLHVFFQGFVKYLSLAVALWVSWSHLGPLYLQFCIVFSSNFVERVHLQEVLIVVFLMLMKLFGIIQEGMKPFMFVNL